MAQWRAGVSSRKVGRIRLLLHPAKAVCEDRGQLPQIGARKEEWHGTLESHRVLKEPADDPIRGDREFDAAEANVVRRIFR